MIRNSSLGDLVRAWAELKIPLDAALRGQVAEMLGMTRRESGVRAERKLSESPPPPKALA